MSNDKVIHNCKHCNKAGASIYDKDSDGYYCCSGCLTAYNFINDKGLDAYYDKRGDIITEAVANVKLDSSVFQRSIKVADDGMNEVTVLINNIRCAACIWLLEKIFLKDDRIKDIRINYSNHKAKIKFDPKQITIDEVLEKITKLGYYPLPFELKVSESDKERRDYFFRFGTSAFFSMQLMLYSAALYTGYFQGIDSNLKNFFHLISWALATPVMVYCAYPFFKNSFRAIKNRHWNMDTLVALGSGSAYIYSIFAIFLGKETYFDTAATIVTLILLGRFIEAGAKQRGGNAVAKLLSLRPNTVKRVDNIKDLSSVTTISIDLLKVHDLFLVEKGESIAADGKIIFGDTDIDESMLTGEPVPVSRSVKDNIFAGAINISSDIIVECTHIGDDTFLSKVAKAVDDAESSKAPIQDIADRFVGVFVPFVLIVATLTFIGSELLTLNTTADNIMRAVSVLVIACPCAMGLATPLAIISATTKLTEIGIIFKNGKTIEQFAKVKKFFFDKTGTITEASMRVEEYKFSSKNEKLLNVASKLGDLSTHPVSKAISLLSNKVADIKIADFSEIAGKGVKGIYNSKPVMLGSLKMMSSNDNKISIPADIQKEISTYQSSGRTVTLFAYNNEVVGVFGIADTIRKDAKASIDLLNAQGNEITILTGDNEDAAKYILSKNNINAKLYANLSPFEKAELISVQNKDGATAMVGDGINDAVALSSATVGVSMRTSTDISMESSQAVLLRNDLAIIPLAHKLSKKALRIIKQNLFWAFSYNIVAIPLAVSGLIHPVMSALFMSFSSLIVIANSSRLKK